MATISAIIEAATRATWNIRDKGNRPAGDPQISVPRHPLKPGGLSMRGITTLPVLCIAAIFAASQFPAEVKAAGKAI
ncbi:MAG: hypothetical protein OET79_12090, partial [Nitrospirota bacterium]|nr:hypothetical protein [Nitrospirota bacterium]